MDSLDKSVFGIDMNLDGKTDVKDDELINAMIEEEKKKRSDEETDDLQDE